MGQSQDCGLVELLALTQVPEQGSAGHVVLGGDVSAGALWLEKVSGCFGGDVKEALHERGAGDAILEIC